jgi:hypothetical protein
MGYQPTLKMYSVVVAFVDVSPGLIEGCQTSLPNASSPIHKGMSKLLEQGESRLLRFQHTLLADRV